MSGKEVNGAQGLTDEQLADVIGGKQTFEQDGKRYKYVGRLYRQTDYRKDWDLSYLCPNCGRPVHYGGWGRYYCDPCDESWFYEEKLRLNLDSGMWQEI